MRRLPRASISQASPLALTTITACLPDADGITRGRLIVSGELSERGPQQSLLIGLVPDGVTRVDARFSNGTSRALAVRDNIYTARFGDFDATTVTLIGKDGRVSLPVPNDGPSR